MLQISSTGAIFILKDSALCMLFLFLIVYAIIWFRRGPCFSSEGPDLRRRGLVEAHGNGRGVFEGQDGDEKEKV